MKKTRIALSLTSCCALLILVSCSGGDGTLSGFGRGLFGQAGPQETLEIPIPPNATAGTPPPVRAPAPNARRGFLGIGGGSQAPDVAVNAHIWAATLDILHFLPLQSVDPYSGVIETGYGTAPGGSRAYRATAVIQSAALDASSLNLSLYTRSGRANAETHAAVADAIMTRARELRIAETR